jgi:integrase/recombinase XerC
MKLIQPFLDYLQVEKNYSSHTIISYKNDLMGFVKFIQNQYNQDQLSEVNYNQIRSWIVFLSKENISNNSINRKISSLKTFYKYLLKIKEVEYSPLQSHKTLKTPQKINIPFNQKEIDFVLNQFKDEVDFFKLRDRLIIELLYSTGMRRSELIELRVGSVDLEQNLIKVLGKRNKERYIPLLKTVRIILSKYIKERKLINQQNDYLFITKTQKKLYGTLVYRVINNYFSTVSTKVKKSPHVLRHAFATHLLNEGADLNAVKDLLGHSSLSSTQIYTATSLDQIKRMYNQAHPRSLKK